MHGVPQILKFQVLTQLFNIPPFSVFLSPSTDLLLICYYWEAIGDKFFVLHHLAALYAYYYVLVSSLLSGGSSAAKTGRRPPE